VHRPCGDNDLLFRLDMERAVLEHFPISWSDVDTTRRPLPLLVILELVELDSSDSVCRKQMEVRTALGGVFEMAKTSV
jgi:hypothetical protein